MDITKLCPEILKQRISVCAKAGDVLFFNSLVTHGPSDNMSSNPQLRCYPNLAPVNTLANPPAEVLDTWLNGTHPNKYAHFFTGNQYKQNVLQSCSPRRHFCYPLGPIGKAIVGATSWTNTSVVQDLTTLFSGNTKSQKILIDHWVEDFTADWEVLVKHQVTRYS